MNFETFEAFLLWLASGAGFAVLSVALIEPIKRWIGLADWPARFLAWGLAGGVGALAMVLLQSGIYAFVEAWWGTVIYPIAVILISQIVYRFLPTRNGN
jgi:hypothetical protein